MKGRTGDSYARQSYRLQVYVEKNTFMRSKYILKPCVRKRHGKIRNSKDAIMNTCTI